MNSAAFLRLKSDMVDSGIGLERACLSLWVDE